MPKRFGAALRIGLSKTGITLLHTNGWMRPRATLLADSPLLADESASPDLLAARLRDLLTETACSNLSTTIVLADAWVRVWTVTPPHNTTRLSDCQAAAAMRFQTLYGESMADWQLEADWNARHPFLACAMPMALLKALRQVAIEHRLMLIGITSQFIAAWNRWRVELNPTAWFGLAHENILTIGAIAQRQLCAVRAAAFPALTWQDQQALPEHLTREALRLNLPPPSQLQLCGDVPGQWTTQSVGPFTCTRLDVGQPLPDGLPRSAGVLLAAMGIRR